MEQDEVYKVVDYGLYKAVTHYRDFPYGIRYYYPDNGKVVAG